MGWISRKGGWDAQTEGEKRGGTKNTVWYCGGRSWQTVRGGSGMDGARLDEDKEPPWMGSSSLMKTGVNPSMEAKGLYGYKDHTVIR